VSKHPQNGPTFSKAPPKQRMPRAAHSPAREQAEQNQKARECADRRRMRKDPIGWLRECGLLKTNDAENTPSVVIKRRVLQ